MRKFLRTGIFLVFVAGAFGGFLTLDPPIIQAAILEPARKTFICMLALCLVGLAVVSIRKTLRKASGR